MEITSLILSPLGTNCYIASAGKNSAVVIDPAADAEKILSELSRRELEAKKILLTHGHYDHTSAAAELREKTGAPIYIHEADRDMLSDRIKSFAYFMPEIAFKALEADVYFKDGDVIAQDDVSFEVMSTPGHSAGSVCFLCRKENVMFSGDTLFKDSIGRSDGYSGDYTVQQLSLDKLSALTDDYTVYPGHGPFTTLAAEKRFNPFLRGL